MKFKKQNYVSIHNKKYLISTVKLSNNWNDVNDFLGYTFPFETMIFKVLPNGAIDWKEIYYKGYSSYEKAIKGHKRLLKYKKEWSYDLH